LSRIYWDSMVFIYWLENHPVFAKRTDYILQTMLKRGDRLCASHLTVGETLTGPIKHNRNQLAAQIEEFFDSGLVEFLPFDRKAAKLFADVRARANVSPADSMHLACAGSAGVDLFLTHDKSLHKLHVSGIHFIAGLDGNVF
jgi:predicted nucleic acid-binding protein